MKKPRVLCVAGPTAAGKTSLAIGLARAFDGEVVSCDSMQVYTGMDVGTAKPTPEEQAAVPHHMIDLVSPEEEYSVARYVADASKAIAGILARGRVPVVAGGTGLYLDALLGGLRFAGREDPEYRRALEAEPGETLRRRLLEVDPESAGRLHQNDRKRMIRALEVYHATGKTISQHNRETKALESPYNALCLGITWSPRERLYRRIEERVEKMLREGWLEETRALLRAGVPPQATSMQAIGYRQLLEVLRGETSLEMAETEIKQATRRYAKRQLTWFRRNPGMRWLDAGALGPEGAEREAMALAEDFLGEEVRS